MAYAIKAEVDDPAAERFIFEAAKTMYGGKRITSGDEAFVFASETQGGAGLVARAIVERAAPVVRLAGIERQTPRVSITLRRTGLALRPLGRAELRRFADWDDGRPETGARTSSSTGKPPTRSSGCPTRRRASCAASSPSDRSAAAQRAEATSVEAKSPPL